MRRQLRAGLGGSGLRHLVCSFKLLRTAALPCKSSTIRGVGERAGNEKGRVSPVFLSKSLCFGFFGPAFIFSFEQPSKSPSHMRGNCRLEITMILN